ncbi:MAG: peptide chain release factor N(5)-glutamine methyltransferase, partial [Chthoniobacterales bacterium]
RRGAREPLQHILGTAEFHGRTFACDKRALIPRPETEQLVEIALEIVKGKASPQILDIGTGSGVIAITIALELTAAEVHAIDLSTDALALAATNAERHELTERLTFHQADLIPPGESKFDLIVANLPYIPADEIASLSPEVRHDPLAALDGGPDGLDLIRRLIDAAPDRLAPGGALLLELGAGQADAVNTLLADRKFRDISVRSDYQNIPRFAVGFHG